MSRRMSRTAFLIAALAAACASTQPDVTASVSSVSLGEPPGPLASIPAEKRPPQTEAVLPNGLRVIVVEHHRRPIVTVRLLFGEGFASDDRGARGATYFATGLLGEFDEDNLDDPESYRSQLRKIGATYEFRVGPDDASIEIDGYSRDLGTYLELVGRMVAAPRHGEETFAEWRAELASRVEDIEAGSDDTLFTSLTRAAFDRNHPYSRSAFGTLEELRALGHEQVLERQRQLLLPVRSALLIVGDVKRDEAIALAKNALSKWTRRGSPERTVLAPPLVEPRRAVAIIPRAEAQSMVICAARPLADVAGARAELEVLAAILGNGVSSRLFAVLRDEQALSYTANAAVLERRYARSLIACTRVQRDDSSTALQFLMETLARAAQTPLDARDVERAKKMLIAEANDRHESVQREMTELGKRFDLGRESISVEQIAAVRAEDVQAIAQKVLASGALQIVLAGPPNAAKRAVNANHLGTVELVRAQR